MLILAISGQHLRPKQRPLVLIRLAGPDLAEQNLGFGGVEVGGLGRGKTVIGGGRAKGFEIGPAIAVRVQITLPAAGIAATDLPERVEAVEEAFEIRIDHRIRTIGRDDAPLPAAVADLCVPGQQIEGAIRCRDDFDIETLEQGARPEGVGHQLGSNRIIAGIGIVGGQRRGDAEQVLQRVVQPEPGRRAAEQVVILGEEAPDPAAIGLDRRAVQRGHPKIFQPDPLAEQHPENIVVRNDQQLGGVGEVLVLGVPARIGVAVRRNNREILHRGIEFTRHGARRRIGRKQQFRGDKAHDISRSSFGR